MGKQKRRKGQQRTGICTYCGAEGPITMDHIFPRALFLVKDQDMLTVPACEPCNQLKSAGDSDLQLLVNLDIWGSQHEDSAKLIESVILRHPEKARRIEEALSQSRDVPLVTETGITLSYAVEIPFDPTNILVTVEMMVKGLYFKEKNSRLSSEVPLEVLAVPWNLAPEQLARLGSIRQRNPIVKGKNVAWWVPYLPHDADEVSTAWIICFNDGVAFVCVTGSLAEKRRDSRDKRRLAANKDKAIFRVSESPAKEIVLPKDANDKYIIPSS